MRIVSFSILSTFVAMVLLTAMWPSGLSAQDRTLLDKETEPAKNAPSVRFSPGTERTIKAEQALKKRFIREFSGGSETLREP